MRKKLILLAALAISLTVNTAFAQLSYQDIINNTAPVNENKKLKELKKIDYRDKYLFIRKNLSVIVTGDALDYAIFLLYTLPKDAFNDKLSLGNYIGRLGENIYPLYKQRIHKDDFNIFYEANLINSVPSYASDEEEINKIYSDYDLFNKKLTDHSFDFSNEKDKELFLSMYKYLFCMYDEIDTNNEKLMNLFNDYFKLVKENKDYKIKSSYNIYRLGEVIAKKYNENSADFIIKKLKDKNTNLEDLCCFLQYVNFNIPVSEMIEKEFDEGVYSASNNMLARMQSVNLSQIDGSSDTIISYMFSKGLTLTPNERLKLIPVFFEDNTQVFNIIDKVVDAKNIPADKKGEQAAKLVLRYSNYVTAKMQENVMENVFEYMIDGIDEKKEQELNKEIDNKWNNFLKNYIENYSDTEN